MDIVLCCDNHFVMPTGVTMYSVCANNTDVKIVFHIIAGGISIGNKEKLKRNIQYFPNKSIVFYDVKKEDFEDLPAIGVVLTHITAAAYYRVYMDEILPLSLEKVLYLDGDVIVRGSLLEIWNTDIENVAVAAVREKIYDVDELYSRLDYPMEKGYFNSGVLLLNLKYWREHNLLAKCKDYMEKYPERIKYVDQDVLNVVCKDHKKWLSTRFNLTSAYLENKQSDCYNEIKDDISDAIEHPVIVHYTGGSKPWMKGCRHPFVHLFLHYYRQTEWKNTSLLENRPLGLRIRKFFGKFLRKWNLIAELPPYDINYYLPGLNAKLL